MYILYEWLELHSDGELLGKVEAMEISAWKFCDENHSW